MTGKLLVAASAVAALIGPRRAEAGCPGGGGGGGGDGGGGGGGGWYGHSLRVEPACEDDSDVVGFRHCTGFAGWGSNLRYPHFIVEAGAAVRRFASLADSQTGSVTHGNESFAYRVVQTAPNRSLDTAVLSTMRAGFGLPHGLYTALEVDLGGLTQTAPATAEMMSSGVFGTPDLQQKRGFVVDGLGVVGIHGAIGSGDLGVELVGGVNAVSYSFHSSYHDCEQATSVTAYAPVAEARARGELWLTPWLTAGVTVGASMIEHGAWVGGLYLGVHSRAFGGER